MKKVTNEDKNRWKIVLIKTIENREPIYYRVVNLYDYSIKTIPAYRILEDLIRHRWLQGYVKTSMMMSG